MNANGLRLVMLGTGTFAEPTLDALLAQTKHQVVGLVTQPDRELGAQRGSTRQTGRGMKAIAQAAGIPVFQPESINTDEGVATLKSWSADLLVTAAYGQILKANVLGSTRLGGINVHGSLLPKYRGAAPVAWAIWRGETHTGVTIIRMTTGLDAGEMLACESTPIEAHETAGDVESRLAVIGAHLAMNVIDRLSEGPIPGEMQDAALVTKAPKLTKEHGLIDWSMPAREIACHIRAMQPWPTAYTFLHRPEETSLRVIILRAQAVGDSFGVPGQARASVDRQCLEVSTGNGLLQILELQPAGRKRMSAADFLRGRSVHINDHFCNEA